MLIAPPGCMKTELVRALDGQARTHLIDTVTPRTFLSGQITEPGRRRSGDTVRPASLLHRIGGDGLIVCPDFSTVLGMKFEDRKAVLADLRRIYDGQLRKEFGTSEEAPEWRGRLTVLVAATPEVDRHYAIFQTLGERFIQIRMARFGEEAALKAMNQDLRRTHDDLRSAVHDLLNDLPGGEPEVSEPMQRSLVQLAEFVVRARTHVPRDRSKAIVDVPEPEALTRLSQQLCQLAKGLARLQHRRTVIEADLKDLRRAGLDCLTAARRSVVLELIDGTRRDVRLPGSTKTYAVQDLQELGLVTKHGKFSSEVKLSDLTGC